MGSEESARDVELRRLRVGLAIEAAKEMRSESAESLRAIDRVLAVGATLAVGLAVLVLRDEIGWVALAGPVAHGAVTIYILDLYTEAVYLGGVRRLQEERLGELLEATPGEWDPKTDVWDTPMVWESRVVPFRVYSPTRVVMVLLWAGVYVLALGVALDWAIDDGIPAVAIIGYLAGLVVLAALECWAALGVIRGSGVAYSLASNAPAYGPPVEERLRARLAQWRVRSSEPAERRDDASTSPEILDE